MRRPADAEAYKQRTLATAARDSTKLSTEAEAFKQRALAEAHRDTVKLSTEADAGRRRALAEAEADATKARAEGDAFAARALADADAQAIDARARSLSGENQQLIAANKLVEMLPALVEAAAHSTQGSQLTVLNGAQGVNDVATGMAAQGLTIYQALRTALVHGNGAAPAPAAAEKEEEPASSS